MKRYLIYATEGTYEGLHGISDVDIIECENDNMAAEIGRDMSIEVIESYIDTSEISEEEYEDWLDENTRFDIWEIDEEKVKGIKYTELSDMAYNDMEGFIEKYCIREE